MCFPSSQVKQGWNSTILRKLWWLNELIHVNFLEQGLIPSKHSKKIFATVNFIYFWSFLEHKTLALGWQGWGVYLFLRLVMYIVKLLYGKGIPIYYLTSSAWQYLLCETLSLVLLHHHTNASRDKDHNQFILSPYYFNAVPDKQQLLNKYLWN